MENEDNIQNDSLHDATDRIQDSANDISIEDSETSIDSVVEETESDTEETEILPTIELTDYSEILAELKMLQEESNNMQDFSNETLLEINMALQHIDETIEYGVCLLIIVLIIVLMQYVYKFFKMFF